MALSSLQTLRNADAPQQVLSAALTLFTQKGFFNTSVQDIGRAAGVSIGSIYHYFDDKQGIAKALYEDLMKNMTETIGGIIEKETSAHDRCRAIVAMLFETAENSRETMEFMLYAKHREFIPDQKPVCSSRPFEIMRAVVEEGMRQGEIVRMTPVVAATSVFGGPIRMITARIDGVLEKPLPEYLDETWQCAWRAVAV
jgi:AcrR family transcriptional regulator